MGWLSDAAAGSILTFSAFSLSFNVNILLPDEITSLLVLFNCLSLSSLAPVRPRCSVFLATFPSFSSFPSPNDRVSPNSRLEARHEADSYEYAEWSDRINSRRALLPQDRSPISPPSLSFLLFLSSSQRQ